MTFRSKVQSLFRYISEKPMSEYLDQMNKMGQVDEPKMLKIIGYLCDEAEKHEKKQPE
jgi:hypothetical protein